MLQRLRSRLHGQEGFTLIELLVVILIIGILAAIAIPAFLNQKGKGEDANAKSAARTAQTALETYATDNDGDYSSCGADGACVTKLKAIEPEVADSGTGKGLISKVTTSSNSWLVTVDSTDGRKFTIERDGTGKVSRTCSVPSGTNRGGCPDSNSW